jgi:hypothetical protein
MRKMNMTASAPARNAEENWIDAGNVIGERRDQSMQANAMEGRNGPEQKPPSYCC